MYTISGLARGANLPRRTVQFWADSDVLMPEGPLLPRKRALFSERELEVVRMLRPFALMSAPISIIRALVSDFRLVLDPRDPFFLKELVTDARRGERAYLVVQVAEYGTGVGTVLSGAETAKDLGMAIALMMTSGDKRLLPIVAIDLTAALCRNDAKAEGDNS